jgi:serine/threonine-protein kinase
MAPERFGPGPVDHRVDVYSLACVLFQCLTGGKPFQPENPLAVMYAHVNNEPPRPGDVDPALARFDHVVTTGMAKDPARRFASAGELARAAKEAFGRSQTRRMPAPPPLIHPPSQPPSQPPPQSPPQSPPAPQPSSQPARPKQRGAGRWWLAAAGLVVLLGLAGFLLFKDDVFPGQPGTGAPTSTTRPDTPPDAPPADLNLSTPISAPACDGRYIVIVGSAVDKDRYPEDVQRFLDENPGAKYLHAVSTGCGSLRKVYDDGTEIYAAYYGPYTSQTEACAKKDQAGGGAFVRTLDNTTPPAHVVSCAGAG